MDIRQATAEHRLSHWSEVIKERYESGLSVKAYCESIGIHTNIYYYWQKKLRAKALSEKEQPLVPKSSTSIVPTGWSACEVVKSEPEMLESKESAIYVEIGKYKIRIEKGTDQKLLSEVCRILESLC